LRRRLLLTLDMIREVEAERDRAIETDNSSINETVRTLCQLRGVGDNFAAVLAKEVFYRTFDNDRLRHWGLRAPAFQVGRVSRGRRLMREALWSPIKGNEALTDRNRM